MMLNYLHGTPTAVGVSKANPEDFVVVEDLGYSADGEGEHLLVRVTKAWHPVAQMAGLAICILMAAAIENAPIITSGPTKGKESTLFL